MNLYEFCGNDGINNYDLLGMDGESNVQKAEEDAKRLREQSTADQQREDDNKLRTEAADEAFHEGLFGSGGFLGTLNGAGQEYIDADANQRYLQKKTDADKQRNAKGAKPGAVEQGKTDAVAGVPTQGTTNPKPAAPNKPSGKEKPPGKEDKFWAFGFGAGAGGAAAGLVENVQNGEMGFWIGKNAKVLRSSFNGNGATGGRLIFAGRMASFAKTGGNVFGGLGLGVSALQGYDAFKKNDANGMVQAGADITVGVIGFTGPIGWAGSTGYFGGQTLDKMFGITDTVAKVVTADPPPITPLLALSPQETF